MKIAIPKCRQRIAPLFEVANRFLIVDTDHSPSGRTKSLPVWRADDVPIDEKCQKLSADGVQVLLCGALSKAWERYLTELGIEVHSFLLGDIDDILDTFKREGADGMHRLAMPGRPRYWGGSGRRANREHPCCGNFCIFSANKE